MYRILFAFNTLVTLLCGFYLVTGLQYDAGGDDMAIWLPILPAGLIGFYGLLLATGGSWK